MGYLTEENSMKGKCQCNAPKQKHACIFEKNEASVAGVKNRTRKHSLEVTEIILPLERLLWFRSVSNGNSKRSVQTGSCVQLFATPWSVARQNSLSITNSWSLLKPKLTNGQITDILRRAQRIS